MAIPLKLVKPAFSVFFALLLMAPLLVRCGTSNTNAIGPTNATQTSAPQPTAPLWTAGHETGDLSEWYHQGPEGSGGVFNDGAADARASQDVAHSGRFSAKATITGDSAVRLFRWNEPRLYTDLYYSAWFYFPLDYKATAAGWSIWQWKSTCTPSNCATGVSDPFYLLSVSNRPDGKMYLRLYNWQTKTSTTQNLTDLPSRRWVHLVAFYRCVGDNTGHVTIWQDSAQLFDIGNIQTKYAGGQCQWSVNNYGDPSPTPAVIYIDDAAISKGPL